jgi:hypothetical protein
MLYEKHFGLTMQQGFSEKINVEGLWKNAKLPYIFWHRIKDIGKVARTIIRKLQM